MLTRVAEGWSCPRGTCNMDRVVTMTIDDEGCCLSVTDGQECFLYEALLVSSDRLVTFPNSSISQLSAGVQRMLLRL